MARKKPSASSQQPKPKPTKSGAVIDLLRSERGASLDKLVEATGWKPHSVRAALTGLKTKGHEIERTKSDGVTCYRITGTA